MRFLLRLGRFAAWVVGARSRETVRQLGHTVVVSVHPATDRNHVSTCSQRNPQIRRALPDLQPVTPDPLTPDELVATAAGRAAAAAAKRAAAAAAANGSKPSTTSSSKGPQAAAASSCPASAPLGPLQRGYHVSLSRTVPIRQQQIAPLTGDLAAELGAQPG